VIQLDTDVSEQKGYDVPWREAGRELPPEELAVRVIARLVGVMGEQFYARHRERFVFAIAVHQIECWLLPLVDPRHAGKIAGCFEAADRACRRAKLPLLTRGEGKNPRGYEEASRKFRRRQRLMKVKDRNPTLRLFVEALEVALAPE